MHICLNRENKEQWSYLFLRPPCWDGGIFSYDHPIVTSELFVSWSLSVYTLNQEFFLQIVPSKMEKPDNEDIIIQIEETLHLFLWPNNITTFPPFQSCFIYRVVLLFVDDVVTSWPQTKISDWSDIKCIVILAVQNRTCSIPKCVSCNF
jgi:hypothetical protein